MRETNAMPLFMVRLKAWDKFQLPLKTVWQEGCFIPWWTKGYTFVRKVCASPRLAQDLRSLEVFTAATRKCTELVSPWSGLGFKWVLVFHQLLFWCIISPAHVFKYSECYLSLKWTVRVFLAWCSPDLSVLPGNRGTRLCCSTQEAEETTDPTSAFPKLWHGPRALPLEKEILYQERGVCHSLWQHRVVTWSRWGDLCECDGADTGVWPSASDNMQ